MNLPVKYRPRIFEEVKGQRHVTQTLVNALKSDRIASALLFSGPRGTGKTTVARLVAKGINCEKGITPTPCNECAVCKEIDESRNLDVIEIDGASNRGVDEIRNIRENVRFLPSRGKKRIFIIDEVHMLTQEAFNALLKTLEEPPSHILFIFATTEPRRLPETVLSRTQKFDFRPISHNDIRDRIGEVAKMEGIKVTEPALERIARYAYGSLRDALSMLEQLSVYAEKEITVQEVHQLLGIVEEEAYIKLLEFIKNRDTKGVLELIENILSKGYSIQDFVQGLEETLSELLRVKLNIEKGVFKEAANQFMEEDIIGLFKVALEMEGVLKYSLRPRLWLDYYVLKMTNLPSTVEIQKILATSGVSILKEEPERKDVSESSVEEYSTPNINEFNKFIHKMEEKHPTLASILAQSDCKSDDDVFYIYVKDPFQKDLLESYRREMEKLLEDKRVDIIFSMNKDKKSSLSEEPILRKLIDKFELEVE